MRKFLFLALLLCPFYLYAYQLQYDRAYLVRLGIDLNQFKVAAVSGNDKVVLGIEQVNRLDLRAKGFVWVLRILEVGPNDAITHVRSVLLPITDIENLAITDDGKIGIITAQYGTKIVQVNLVDGKLKTIFSHEEGKPGFRCRRLCWYHNGKFYTEGYFYDKGGYWLSDAVVELDLSHPNSVELFKKTWDTGDTTKSLGQPRLRLIVSGDEAFWGISTPKTPTGITMDYYNNGAISTIDQAEAYGGWACTDHRILFAALRVNGVRELMIKDTALGKSWTLYSGQTSYLYPYLARDGGGTAVVATIDFKQGKMSYFYAKEKDNFQLQPLADLQIVPLGVFRLSPDGKHYTFVNRDGLYLGDIP